MFIESGFQNEFFGNWVFDLWKIPIMVFSFSKVAGTWASSLTKNEHYDVFIKDFTERCSLNQVFRMNSLEIEFKTFEKYLFRCSILVKLQAPEPAA